MISFPTIMAALTLTATSAATIEGYDFKGARLGMTFDEWKTVAPPINVAATNSGKSEKDPPVAIWCSNTKYQIVKGVLAPAVSLTKAEEIAGVTTCAYGRMIRFMGSPLFSRAWINVGDGVANDVIYKFRNNVLYEISIETVTQNYLGVMSGLTAKFGSPAEETSDTVTNGYGSDFPHTKKTWVRGDYVIHLEAPYKKISQMKVAYFIPSEWQAILDAQPKGPPAASKM